MISTGYSGQFGGAAGGNINYITKSGSNEYHGNAQYYWNGRVLNANDWFNNANGIARPFDIANQWAGSFGGPIRKGKLFFFLDAEGLRLVLPQTYQVVIPSPQFEVATIKNIDSKFGSDSASDVFYQKIFALYNAAPGASSAQPGGLSPSTDPSGCTGFTGLGIDPNTNMPVPCAMNFVTSVGRPSSDSLGSGPSGLELGIERPSFCPDARQSGFRLILFRPHQFLVRRRLQRLIVARTDLGDTHLWHIGGKPVPGGRLLLFNCI